MLLVLIEGSIIPHEELECWVEPTYVVRAPQPWITNFRLSNDLCTPAESGLTMNGKAVTSVRVARGNKEHILWYFLIVREKNVNHFTMGTACPEAYISIYSPVDDDLLEKPQARCCVDLI